MAQIIIDTGAAANDGTGDPLRTAFTDTNTNFTEIYTAGPVDSNVQIANNTIRTINTNGNLVLAPNGVGVVQSNVNIVPNSSNIRNLGSTTQRWSSLYVQYANISGSLDLAGNFSAATVTTPELIVNTISSDDSTVVKIQDGVEIDGDTLVNGNVTADYFIGDGSQLTGLAANYGNANVVTLLAGFGNSTVSTTGNISGGYLFGNGSQLIGIAASYGNANVVTLLAGFGNSTVSTTGNISGNTAGFAIGYRDIPQVAFTANATTATTDAGKHYYSTQSTSYILTIANNASQSFQTGAAISIVNQGTGNITVAQGSGVTLYVAGNATAGNRTVATFGMATIMKVDTNTWFINGTGVS